MTRPVPRAQTAEESFRAALTALWEGQLDAALDVVDSDPPDDRLEALFAVAFEADLDDEDYDLLLDGLAGMHLAGAEAASELVEPEDEDEDADARAQLTGNEIESALGRARLSAAEAAPEMLRNLRDESSRMGARRTLAARRRGDTIAEQRDSVETQITGWFRPGHAQGIQSRLDLETDTRRVIQQNRGGLAYYSENRVANVVVSDGTDHDEECQNANGQTWTLTRASANPLQHPNCVRSFEPAQRRRLAPTRATIPAMTHHCRLPFLGDRCDGVACAAPAEASAAFAAILIQEARVRREAHAETDGDSDSDAVVLPLYGLISDDWGIGLRDVQRTLTEANGRDVIVRVHSAGGSAFTGNAIYTALSEYEGRVTARVDGIAASAAAVAIMGAAEIRMPPAASMMIHEAWVLAIGGRHVLEDMLRLLDGIEQQFAEILARRTGETPADWSARLDGHDLWYTARQAVDAGLADVIDEPGEAPPPLDDADDLDDSEDEDDMDASAALDALADASLAEAEALLHSR